MNRSSLIVRCGSGCHQEEQVLPKLVKNRLMNTLVSTPLLVILPAKNDYLHSAVSCPALGSAVGNDRPRLAERMYLNVFSRQYFIPQHPGANRFATFPAQLKVSTIGAD